MGSPCFAEDEDVFGHDVGVIIAWIRLFDHHPRPLDSRRTLMPHDILVEIPPAGDQPGDGIKGQGDVLAVQQHGSDDDGAESPRLGHPQHLLEDHLQPIQITAVIGETLAVSARAVKLAPVLGMQVVIDGVPIGR
jgi:hypothetical protein